MSGSSANIMLEIWCVSKLNQTIGERKNPRGEAELYLLRDGVPMSAWYYHIFSYTSDRNFKVQSSSCQEIVWLLSPNQKVKSEEDEDHSEKLAEVDGGVWERLSVFEHIEQGFNRNPDSPAVICTFQPADHLEEANSTASIPIQNGNANGMLALWKPESSDANPIDGNTQQDYLTLTYSQLHNAAFKLVSGLLANGAKLNTTVIMLIPNSGEYAILLWACILLRITYVSLDPALLEISGFSTLKQMLRLVKPQIVVAPDAQSGKALDVAISELQLPRTISLCLSNTSLRTSWWKSLAEFAATGAKCPADESALITAARGDHPQRIYSIMFTSGTSGLLKGCPQTVGGMSHALHSQAWLVKAAALFPCADVCVNQGMTEEPGAFVWPFSRNQPSEIPFFGEIAPIGAVAPGCVVRVRNTEKGGVVGRGQLGELYISCPSVICHYLGGRSEESFYDDAKGRWFNTGDMAMVDRDGVGFILGRRKDMIKRAGVAIMPAAMRTIVVPVTHHVLGTEPFAVLSSHNGKTEQQIKDHVRIVLGKDYALGGLASMKQLELVEFPFKCYT
ncbi:hypothetical protein F4810DRAFT_712059 [Camillea tinctor]|nr:hypothetical protein F4810DRAFT_712059 [Camillea tinctor]